MPAQTAAAAAGRGLGAVVFDLDGTLVDTAPDLHAHLNDLLAGLGRGPVGLDAVRPMIGDGARVFIQRALTATGGPPNDVALDDLVTRFVARYTEDPLRGGGVFPGAVEALEALAARGVGLGVCTNKPQRPTERLLELLGVARHFGRGAVIGGDALPVRKPDGGHLRAVLERLGVVEPDRAAMVGDSRNDVLTARALGAPCVVVSFGYTTVPPGELGADAVIDRFGELLPALDRLVARRAAQGHSKKAGFGEGEGVEAVLGEGGADGGERPRQGVDQAECGVAQGGARPGRGA